MKTIYITEAQKKKLKKAIAAQDQVGGKVNAGVMDAVVGGMCEEKEQIQEAASTFEYHYTTLRNLISMMATDTFNLTDSDAEDGRRGQYYMSLTRMRNNAEGYGYGLREESPLIRIELNGDALNNIRNVDITPYDYIYSNYERFKQDDENVKRGRGRTDGGESNEAEDSLTLNVDQIKDASLYINRIDILLRERVDNIKLWDKFLNRIDIYTDWREKMHFFANINDFNYQINEIPFSKIYSMYSEQFKNSMIGENVEDDEYKLGAEKGDISPYYHVNESEEEIITLYHGVNRKGLEFNLEHGGFIPRVCSEGGPKAVWLSEKQYNYEFTFAFDIPKSEVEQLSNVDYIYRNEITFDTFNCRLVRSSIYIYLDNSTCVEVNLLNDKLSKLHFRYFPDLGILLWKEFKQYPNILEKFINPYIEKYQQLSESIDINKENRMVDINQVINSPEFKAWFGDSKVVDKNGNPLIVHHGSPKFEGDKFNKEKIGSSINGGESGVFCTTQDMSWAKRFSYPASPGTFNFTVKLDYSHPGDILSGFLKLEHPLDFFNLSDNDIQNMFKMNIKYDEFGQAWIKKIGKKEYYKKFYNEIKQLINIGNHNLIKFYIHRNLGEALKEFGYDGYIALMKLGDSAIEYCFIEPNQFKSIYSFAFNPNSDSIYENKSNINTKEKKTNFGKVWYINAVDNSFRFALYKYDDDSNCLYLSNVFVEESSRRQGLGNYILNLTNDFAKKMNVKEIFLKVKKGTFMCKWYEKNGYEYFSDDETDSNYIWMVKEVKQNNIIENKKKVIKNDKGETVPDKCDKCGGKIVLQIHGEPVYVCKDCGKYFGTMPFNLKENIENEISPEEVDLSSFNIKKKLNPKFWIDGHLDSRIRLKLLDISDDFIEYLGIEPDIVKDIIMTGSLANYNWNEEYSDIDLHVLLDYSDVDENVEFVKQYFMAQKNLWNDEHKDLKIFGFPVEVYVQDINEKHDSSGVYSLDGDKWLREPDRDVLVTSKVNKRFIKDKVSEYTNKIDKLIYLYKKSKGDEYKLGKIAKIADNLWDEIKNTRKHGFEISGGKELNNGNIIFKSLRRGKYLDKLYKLKTKTYDKLMSIK